jgi:hypothetical protein
MLAALLFGSSVLTAGFFVRGRTALRLPPALLSRLVRWLRVVAIIRAPAIRAPAIAITLILIGHFKYS